MASLKIYGKDYLTEEKAKKTTLNGKALELKASFNLNIDNVKYFEQRQFNKYVIEKFGIKLERIADMVFLTPRKIYIIEVKNQSVSGSVIDKMLGAGSMVEYYRHMFKDTNLEIQYSYAVSTISFPIQIHLRF